MSVKNRIETIEHQLREALTPGHLEVIDDSHQHIGHAGAQTGLGHFTVRIASPLFKDKTTLSCHRMIYDALGSLMQTDIHALCIECLDNA